MTEEKQPKSAERIGERLARALDLMTWGDETGKPMEWNEAARTVGISARSMRRSLERAVVRRYLMQQKEVLRVNLTARNSFHLNELVSQRNNFAAAVSAARLIENLDETDQRRPMGPVSAPGLTIQIINAPAPGLPSRFPTEQAPAIDHDETHANSGKTALLRGDGPHD
jgi:hypothetical protein